MASRIEGRAEQRGHNRALAGSGPAAGLREVLANLDREVEAYARLEAEDAARKEWALADRWRYMASGVAQAVEAVRQYVPALAATPTASPTATGEREHRFTTWDDTSLVVTVDDDDPGDMGEPRTLVDYDNGPTTYLSVKSCGLAPNGHLTAVGGPIAGPGRDDAPTPR